MTELVMRLQSSLGLNKLKERFAVFLKRRAVYNRTYQELSSLSDRELADLGFHRSEIKRVAMEACYDNRIL